MERAIVEMARAHASACPEAAIAHEALSELHLEQARALGSEPDRQPFLSLVA